MSWGNGQIEESPSASGFGQPKGVSSRHIDTYTLGEFGQFIAYLGNEMAIDGEGVVIVEHQMREL